MAHTIPDKLCVLRRIAAALNAEGVTWAVGASLLLYLEGIADHFNDIDLMVLEADAERARAILSGLGELNPPNPKARYATKHFHEFVIGGVDVDMMAGFAIIQDGIVWDCSLTPEQIVRHADLDGADIPLQSVALWRRYYQLMQRDAKVAMIDQANKTRGE